MDMKNSRPFNRRPSSRHFDPFRQTVFIRVPGKGRIPIPIEAFDLFTKYGIRICINYSSQIGASLVLLVVLILLTRPEKRWTPVFALNTLSLLFNAIRSIFQCIYFSGPFYNPYAYYTQDYSKVPDSQYAASIAGVVFTLLLVMCLETSLVLQVRAVCATMTRLKRTLVLFWSVTIALIAVGFRFALTVENSISILNAANFHDFEWLAASSNYVITASICYASLIFVVKLGVALKERQRLGLRQFGPMQIIFIMGCQTLFIPAIFSVLQNFTTVPELGSQTLTLVAIFLPLSSMWASHSINSPTTSTSHLDKSHRRKLLGILGAGSKKSEKSSNAAKQSHAETPTTRATDSPSAATYKSDNAEDDLECGEYRIYKTRSIDVSKERKGGEET